MESRVEPVPPAVRITHVFEDRAKGIGSRPSRSPATSELALMVFEMRPRSRARRADIASPRTTSRANPSGGKISMSRRTRLVRSVLVLAVGVSLVSAAGARAQAPEVVDHNLAVRTAASGLSQPVAMAFLGRRRYARAREGHRPGPARGPRSSGRGARPRRQLRLRARAAGHRPAPGLREQRVVYLYWTESTPAPTATARRPCDLLGNRVDRFLWNGSTLTFDRNLIQLPRVPARRRPAAARATTTAA